MKNTLDPLTQLILDTKRLHQRSDGSFINCLLQVVIKHGVSMVKNSALEIEDIKFKNLKFIKNILESESEKKNWEEALKINQLNSLRTNEVEAIGQLKKVFNTWLKNNKISLEEVDEIEKKITEALNENSEDSYKYKVTKHNKKLNILSGYSVTQESFEQISTEKDEIVKDYEQLLDFAEPLLEKVKNLRQHFNYNKILLSEEQNLGLLIEYYQKLHRNLVSLRRKHQPVEEKKKAQKISNQDFGSGIANTPDSIIQNRVELKITDSPLEFSATKISQEGFHIKQKEIKQIEKISSIPLAPKAGPPTETLSKSVVKMQCEPLPGEPTEKIENLNTLDKKQKYVLEMKDAIKNARERQENLEVKKEEVKKLTDALKAKEKEFSLCKDSLDMLKKKPEIFLMDMLNLKDQVIKDPKERKIQVLHVDDKTYKEIEEHFPKRTSLICKTTEKIKNNVDKIEELESEINKLNKNISEMGKDIEQEENKFKSYCGKNKYNENDIKKFFVQKMNEISILEKDPEELKKKALEEKNRNENLKRIKAEKVETTKQLANSLSKIMGSKIQKELLETLAEQLEDPRIEMQDKQLNMLKKK